MKNTRRLQSWQIILIVIGASFILAPMVWDTLVATFDGLKNIKLEDIFTREGFAALGLIILVGVGIHELVKDAGDKPTSKYIK